MGKRFITLDNGLRVLLDRRKDALSVYVTLAVNVGAFFPQSQKIGLAHVLEHNICNNNSEEIFNKVGTTLEAFTYDYNTIYAVRTFKEHLNLVFNTLFETVFDALFSKEFFNSEKKVIKEEYKKQRANVMGQNAFKAAESFYEGTFISGSGYGIGNSKQVDAITYDDVVGFYNEYYGLNNSVLVVTGNFNENDCLKKIKALCKKFAKTAKTDVKMVKNDINLDISHKINVLSSGKDQTCSTEIMFSAAREDDEDFYTYKCLSYMFCGMFSHSVVRDRLRRKLAIVYECDADVDGNIPYKDCGTLSIRYYVANQNVIRSIVETFKAVCSLLKEKNQTVLDIAKTCLVNDTKMKCENLFASTLLQVSSLVTSSKVFDVFKVEKQIKSITHEDICLALKNILSKKIVVSVLGTKVDASAIKKELKEIIQEVV